MTINEEQRTNMLRALGNPKLRCDWKPQTNLNKCYRNKFFVYKKNKIWEDLVIKDFAKYVREYRGNDINGNHLYHYFYYVAEKGMKELIKDFVINSQTKSKDNK